MDIGLSLQQVRLQRLDLLVAFAQHRVEAQIAQAHDAYIMAGILGCSYIAVCQCATETVGAGVTENDQYSLAHHDANLKGGL